MIHPKLEQRYISNLQSAKVHNFKKEFIGFELDHRDATLPKRADDGSAGYDLTSIEHITLNPGEFQVISTGLKAEFLPDIEFQIRPRSGMAAKYGVTVLNAPGTIDSSFKGVIGVILINLSKLPYEINIGDRIAQGILAKVPFSESIEIDKVTPNEERGEGGFGSTGR